MGGGQSNLSGEEEWISLGPWGENVGKRWAYKAEGPILEITVCFDHFIRSIVLTSKSCDGVVISSFGEAYPTDTETLCINSSEEQLSSISLTYGPYGDRQSVISFLCFETNIGIKYGPFGGKAGASFVSIPIEGGVLAGFHGCSDGGGFFDGPDSKLLTAIGVFLAPKVYSLPSSEQKVDSLRPIQDPDSVPIQAKGKISDEEGWIYLGPWGGKDGVDWAYKASGPVVQISICYGEVIDSILFRSRSFDGLVIESSEKIGGSGGYTTETFCIDNSVEQLLNISLTYEDFDGQVAIKSICFYTNLSNYGPFGLRSGASFVSIPIEGGVLVGFHGRGGTNLTAIGVIVAPKVNNLLSFGKPKDPDCAPTQLKGKIGSEEGWMSLGPWGSGGKDGVDWAYKFRGPIIHISIVYGEAIDSITCESKSYNGVVVGSSGSIGSTRGILSKKVIINTSSEQLMSMSFTYGELSIQSLSIYTNLKKYGPFGSGTGASFVSIPLEGGVFGGFHGHTDGCDNITAFGVFVAPKFNSLYSIQDPDFVPKQLKSKISGGGGCISLGPFGEERYDNWAYKPDGPVLQVTLWSTDYVSGILFESKTCDGVVKGSSGKIGSCGGNPTQTFCIDSSVEELSSITVTGGDNNGSRVITSLCFETNIGKKYGHFELAKSAFSVSFPVKGGTIAGFHGYAYSILTAIGIFVAPKVNRLASSEKNVDTLLPSHDPDSTPTRLKGNISDEGRIFLGPWGGKDGVEWDYKPNGPILQISICYGEAIDSILFRSRSFNGLVIGSSERIGGTGGRTTKTFCIDDSIEQLVNISLTYEDCDGQVAIKSLCFDTNRNTYGPFGTASIYSSMSIRIGGGVIVGFYGRGGTHLTAIGIVVAPNVNMPGLEENFNRLSSVQDLANVPTHLKGKISNEEGWMSLGPWGGEYGADWSYIVDGPIMQISIGYGRAINSILCESKAYDDMVIGSSGTIGSPYGHLTQTFCIDTSIEQLKSISLTYGDYYIDSLCFDTNRNKYGPFGLGKGASSKCILVEDGVLVGFHGRTDGSYITAIGMIIANKFNSLHSTQDLNSVQNQLQGNTSNEEGWRSLPLGGKDGEDWSYKVKGPIMRITIGYGKAINSISCTSYDGLVVGFPQKFGSTNGRVTETFCFNTSEEQLTSISLKYDNFHGKVAITTLCFKTNLNKYGPFGSGTGASSESIPIEGGVFHGFHGRTNSRYITAIGIFLAPKVNSLHSVQDQDSAPIHLKALGSGVGSKPKMLETPTIEPKGSSRFLAPKFKANFCGFKPETLENILPYTASSSATTNKDEQHRGAPSPSSEMIRKDLHLVDSAFQKYVILMNILNNLDLVEMEFEKYGIKMYMQIYETRDKLKLLQRYGRKESEKFEQLQKLGEDIDIQINRASERYEEEQKLWSRGRDFDELGNIIAKLKFQIRLATKSDDHNGGALSPRSTLIHRNLSLLYTASAEAEESTYHMNVKIDQAYEKFKELQRLASSERDSGKQQKIDSDKKELLEAITKLKVRSNNKVRSTNSNPHKKNWDNINGAENGMTHFFHKEPEVADDADCDGILKAFHDLPKPLHDCLFCFFKFPPKAIIKRTPMIYLWIGQGYISAYLHSEGYIWDVEVHAGKIFDELTAKGFIEPINKNCSLLPESCTMSPSVRSSLYEEAKRAGFTSHGILDLNPASVRSDPIRGSSCLINVGAAIVNFQSELFESMEHIRSLYLGRWQSSPTHHIELATTKILCNLNKLKRLTFLSLRGISMIMELPTCISNLNDLMILDLRACYNLKVIPDKIGLLKKLTHLDMSECYNLENMPKSLAQLSNLQVLKGFLIGDFNNKQSCTVRNLAGLQKLRKLDIHISVKDPLWLRELKHLEGFEGLKRLTISWGLQSQAKVITETFRSATFPPRLEKLDLQCFPMTSLTNWLMPGKLKELKKLYIRGGNLRHLGEFEECQVEQWSVEILRLKYLSELELNWRELTTKFPKLIFLHQVDCPKFINFPCDKRGVWINKMIIHTHVQLQKYNGTSGMISSSSTSGSC